MTFLIAIRNLIQHRKRTLILGGVLSGVFVATFGWLPGIAAVIAVIVAKRFGKSGYDAVCKTWKEQLG